MEENNVVTVEGGEVVENSDRLTTTDKVVVGLILGGTALLGYFGGKGIEKLGRKGKQKFESEFERAKNKVKGRKKRKNGVDYDEDGEFRDVEEDEED